MNSEKLQSLGVPSDCCEAAIEGVKLIAADHKTRGEDNVDAVSLSLAISEVVDEPENYVNDRFWADLARSIIESKKSPFRETPAPMKVWGREGIDENTINQMNLARELPMATRLALMGDGHLGYGLAIGGVLALKNAIAPYCVGVDIACRMKLSVLDMDVKKFHSHDMQDNLDNSLEEGTRWGMGCNYGRSGRMNHDVMDDDRWGSIGLLSHLKEKAWEQLGTSGSGNHFCEFGILTIEEMNELGLEAGEYVALLSHSGSRGAGARICDYYSKIAKDKLPNKFKEHFTHLAWLDMDSEEGQEYWTAMNLMGDYASANHDVIHKQVSKLAGCKIVTGVENHHNFAWKEDHDGQEVYVHRKGATPAGKGVLGVIPGSMGTPAYVVRGLGSVDSMDSASHGAGRVMSRTKAKDTFAYGDEIRRLAAQGVRVLSAGADEVPGVYKKIDEVMACQKDLVEAIARFDPKVVKMCGDGSKAED